MQKRLAELERTFELKQQEISRQMEELRQKNCKLETDLEEERSKKVHPEESPGYSASPPFERDLQTTPPPSSSKKSHRSGGTGRRLSVQTSLEHSGRRQSTTSRATGTGERSRRKSVAAQALSSMHEDAANLLARSANHIGETVVPAKDINSQRRWWAQQRAFLLDDLYDGGASSPLTGFTPGGRSSMVGGRRPSQAEVGGNKATGCAIQMARVPAPVAEEPDAEDMPPSVKGNLRINLAEQFEANSAVPEGRGLAGDDHGTRRQSKKGASVFNWNRRRSGA
jgi:hypothetical protein